MKYPAQPTGRRSSKHSGARVIMLLAQLRKRIAGELTMEGWQNESKLQLPYRLGEKEEKNPLCLGRRSSKYSDP